MAARKHGRSARLCPRETPGRKLFGFGSPLFWRGCEALEILLTRIFAEQYYKTRDGSSHRGKRLSGDPFPVRENGAHLPHRPRDGGARASCVLNGPQDCGKVPAERRTSPLVPFREGRSKAICRRLGPTSLALRSGAFPCRLVLPSPHDGISGEPHANVLLNGSVRGDALPVRSRCNSLRGGAGKNGGGDTVQLGGWSEALL